MADEVNPSKCPKCSGILDSSGTCPWCKDPPPKVSGTGDRDSGWQRPSWLVIIIGAIALVPFTAILLVPTVYETGQEAINSQWAKNVLFALGLFFAVIAGRQYLREKGDL